MSTFTTIVSCILLLIFLISGGLMVKSAYDISYFQVQDQYIQNAHYYATWAAVITWILVALVIILIGVYFWYSAEVPEAALEGALAKTQTSSWWSTIYLFIIFILVIIVGILAAQAAFNIDKSPNYNSNIPIEYAAREGAIATAVLCLGSTGLLIVWFIYDLIPESKPETPNKNLSNLTPEELAKYKMLVS